MTRRQGFTLVELLVSMALIIFIMAILSQAFGAAMTTFRNLKALGDMAEKLRATTQLLQRDLSADHFEGKRRLSDPNFWLNGPPQQGFFQIYQGNAGTLEGVDLDAIGSYYSTSHSLAFTVKLRGNDIGNFFSAGTTSGGALLSAVQTFGPPETRYQGTPVGAYNYPWAEVAWFLQPSGEATITDPTTGAAGVPLYNLYRHQRLLVPDNNSVTQAYTPPGGIPVASAGACLEISCWPNAATGYLYFNSPIDATDPLRRFGSSLLIAAPPSVYPTPATFTTFQTELTQLGTANPTLMGADIQLTNVVSFDVRVLTPGVANGLDPFVTLWQAPFNVLNTAGGMNNGNPGFFPVNPTGPMVFDTWSSLSDGLGAIYAGWNAAGAATSIPLWNPNATPPVGPIIQAIQISIRIWDYKTNQTRQVTIVQAM